MVRQLFAAGCVGALLSWLCLAAPADDKKDDKKADADGLIIVDSKGKENKIKSYEILKGTRRLGWLAPPAPEKKPEDKDGDPAAPKKPPLRTAPALQGPEALVFQEQKPVHWAKDVQTFILLDRVRSLDYDADKDEVTVKVATGAKSEDDLSLTGTTKFDSFNRLVIEAEVDKGELGIAAIKFSGGTKEGSIKAVRFPTPKAATAPTGRAASVTVKRPRNAKDTEKVTDLMALYRSQDGEKASPVLLFRKTIKLDVAKLKKLKPNKEDDEWTLTLKDDSEETLTLLTSGELDGKQVQLEGFLGKVPAGWKLFPVLTVLEIQFDEAKQS